MRLLLSKNGILVPLAIIFFIFTAITASNATIVVKPGKLDHFSITIINAPVAGEYFLAKIEAYDSNGNFITEYAGPGEGFQISVSGKATVTPSVIKARDFSGGVVVKIVDEKAEDIDISVLEIGGSVPISSIGVSVAPNKLDHFDITTVDRVTAGEIFQSRMVARDVFGNVTPDFKDGSRLRIELLGRGVVKAEDSRPIFRTGESAINFKAEKAGDVKILVRDTASPATGQSNQLTVVPAKADHFNIVAPKAAIAGEKFSVSITAFDRFENPVVDFNEEKDSVLFSSSTGRKIIPAIMSSRAFNEGRAVIEMSYETAESFKITAQGKNDGPAGESETITISSAEPDHFILNTPNTAVAGENFTVIIESKDRFNNQVLDYNLIGGEVFLSADGSGELYPASVPPSIFVNGKAEVMLRYSKAESFNLMAALKGKVRKRKIENGVSPEEQEKLRAEEAEKKLRARMEAQREREKAQAVKAREEALLAREKALKAREEETKAEALKKQEEALREEEARKIRKAPETPVEEKKTVPAVTAAPPAKKETPSEAAKVEEKIEKKVPVKEAAPLQVAKPRVQKLEAISLMESDDQVIIFLKLTGPVNYDVNMSSSMAHEWIFVEFNPAVRDTDKVVENMITESALIGQIRTSEKNDEKVEVAIEVLPKNISYTVEQDGNAIVVKITKAQ